MFLPILIALLVIYFFASSWLIRRLLPRNGRLAAVLAIAGALVIFAGDHVVGLAYAYWWVREVPKPPAMPIVADAIALELATTRGMTGKRPREEELLGAYAMEMVDADYWVAKGYPKGGLLAGYSSLEGVIPGSTDGAVFRLAAVTEERNSECRIFRSFPPTDQERWRRLAAESLVNGANARCVAIVPIGKINASHLYRKAVQEANAGERLLGFGEISSLSIREMPANRVVAEYRAVNFSGGWVQRTFWTSMSTGMTNIISISTPGPLPSLRPASPQRVS